MKILHLEDSAPDVELVQETLRREWPEALLTAVATREAFVAELVPERYDLILSDYRLPDFSGTEALAIARIRLPDTPFVFLSGTVGEETAIELIRAGAADFLVKDRLDRLPFALNRVLSDHGERVRRREAETRVREQADLLDQARDGIVVTDLASHIVFWNRGAERIFGWTAAETINRRPVEFFGTAAEPDLTALAQSVDREGEWHGELRLDHKQHHTLTAEVRATLIRDEHGRPKSRLAIITDITEKKNLEAQFLRAQRLESLGMLAAGIAHDLNNILAPVLMGAPLLRSLATETADQRVLDTIEKSATRGAALVRQILSFAHGSAGHKTLIQPKHLLRDIADLIQQTFPKSITLESEIPTNLWTIRGNPTQLHQILLNLCVNARDALPRGGRLKLSAANVELSTGDAAAIPSALPGAFVVLTVQDTGTGISPENLAQIWEPFFTTKGEEKGTGLGLSTVRGITASHGGFATVESELGRGTTFRVYLPAAEHREYPDQPASHPRSSGKRGRGELILVVDDEDTIRALISAILRRDGYHVVTAANGVEASAIITPNASAIHLLITDLSMPEMDGADLAVAVRRINPAIKILFMSGAGRGLPAADRLPRSASTINKPFTPEDLLTRVRSELDAS